MRGAFAKIKKAVSSRPILIAAVAAIVAALFASGYLKRREAQMLQIVKPIQVVVAADNIRKGEVLDEASLKQVSIPRKFAQPGTFEDLHQAAGRIAMVSIKSGTQITLAIAGNAKLGFGLVGLIPEGRRAASVGVDDISGVDGLIWPRDMVDVIASFDLKRGDIVESTSLVVVENVEVLAVDKRMAGNVLPVGKDKPSGMFGNTVKHVAGRRGYTVTLSVTPVQAQVLAYANRNGLVSLALRSLGDEHIEDGLVPTTIGSIVKGHAELIPRRKLFREYKGR